MPTKTKPSRRNDRPKPAGGSAASTVMITAREASTLLHLDPREQFYVTLWSLVQVFDPATAATQPLPDEYRFGLLTSSDLRRLRTSSPAEAEKYLFRKAARDEWARRVWLVVPAWGGRKGPCSEWRFSAERCGRWGDQLLGGTSV